MAEGAEKARWNHTADIQATIANCRPFGRGRRIYRRQDFLPPNLAKRDRGDALPAPISVLKMFLPPER